MDGHCIAWGGSGCTWLRSSGVESGSILCMDGMLGWVLCVGCCIALVLEGCVILVIGYDVYVRWYMLWLIVFMVLMGMCMIWCGYCTDWVYCVVSCCGCSGMDIMWYNSVVLVWVHGILVWSVLWCYVVGGYGCA